VVRFGAFGDMLQTSALLPELKRQGYHITLLCQAPGNEAIQHDPHVDEFWVNDRDQVPNNELPAFWTEIAPQFDRFINLSECVEGSLLAIPGRANHGWPKDLRHEMMNRNYSEFMARIAELPFTPEGKFYPTDEEREWAEDFKASLIKADLLVVKTQRPFLIVWALAGSSVHKFYPNMDPVIAAVLRNCPDAHVALIGEPACKIIEAGWENEPRVHLMSGETTIRQSMALAQVADVVVGPETGVLNAVAYESNAKVVLLSHSSHENLTKHWVNTYACATTVTPCYPCHRLHYTRDFCPEHKETGAAMCQADLHPQTVWEAIHHAYDAVHTRRKLMGLE
jgi:ADP-heptose:LPS heptosyltransferase